MSKNAILATFEPELTQCATGRRRAVAGPESGAGGAQRPVRAGVTGWVVGTNITVEGIRRATGRSEIVVKNAASIKSDGASACRGRPGNECKGERRRRAEAEAGRARS